jgi:monoterpene epsilon-lactone hydrolase
MSRALHVRAAILSLLFCCGAGQSAAQTATKAERPPQAVDIPFSSFASPDAKRAWDTRNDDAQSANLLEKYHRISTMTPSERQAFTLELREWWDTTKMQPLLEKQTAAYGVDITPGKIAGIYTETFTPKAGISPANADRVLINLHGGGFSTSARIGGQVESIPVAAVARIKVISIDYRQAPEFQFPSATEDVVAVYRELLKTYKPGNIGIYGCSAGGTLTAQVVASLIMDKLPRPGAVGMFCGTGEVWAKGDSAYFWALLNGYPLGSAEHNPQDYDYLKGLNTDNPRIFPMRYREYLPAFPPSLLLTGTRSFEMSTVIDAHNKLVAAGTRSELHVWDGVMHAFLYDPTLPESREAYDVVAKFFARYLGKPWYAAEFESFLSDDLGSPTAPCGIVFTGSSSIKLWESLSEDMAPMKVLNRGFGGSTIPEIDDNFDRVITPYRPRAIFFYAGENDISFGRKPQDVLDAFARFMQLKERALGDVPVYFLSLKPSKLRMTEIPAQQEANRLMKRFAATRQDLHYVDVASAMLDHGQLRDIYRPDGLHMTAEGYRIWTGILRPLVMREAAHGTAQCPAQPMPEVK